MNRISGVVKLHFRDRWSWLYIPWIILLSSFFVNLVIGLLLSKENGGFYSGGMSSFFIYMLVIGTISLSQTFPFALGLSIRRRDYFFGTAAAAALLSTVSAVILWMLSVIESRWTGGWGVQLQFFHQPFLSDLPQLGQIGVFILILLHLFFLGFAVTSIYFRYGRNGLFLFFGALFLLGTIFSFAATYYGWWVPIGRFAVNHYVTVFLWMLPVSAIYALAAYTMLRKAPI